jgi:hypothetical protein
MTDLVTDMRAQLTAAIVTSATVRELYTLCTAVEREIVARLYPGLALEFAAVERDEDRQRRMAAKEPTYGS